MLFIVVCTRSCSFNAQCIFPFSEYILPLSNLLGVFILMYYHRSGLLLSSIDDPIEELKDCSWSKIIWGKEYKTMDSETDFYPLDMDQIDKIETTIKPSNYTQKNKDLTKKDYFSSYTEVNKDNTHYLKQNKTEDEPENQNKLNDIPEPNKDQIKLDDEIVGVEPDFEMEGGLKAFDKNELIKSVKPSNNN